MADNLLSRLDKVKPTGPGRWIACCPSHKDKSPSLAVRELDDGRTLVHCFAGCSALDVVSAAGLEMDALFPERAIQHGKPERRPFPAADVLRCVAFETLVVTVAAASVIGGTPLNELDRARLMLASGRIQAAIDAAGVRYE